ncbi:MAG: helix-turn-helix domain-containing protein [Lachnospiraceae bacterium]|nr:helix-turn-helix domain-containing protein [Lachnospiraceae bacterium]
MEHELYEQKKMADFILKMRKARNLTQKDLAGKLGVTDKAVSKWERAVSSPDISLLIPLAKALGVSTGELLSGEKMEMDPDNETPIAAKTVEEEQTEFTDGTENKEETETLINEALKYSRKSADQRVKKLWDILFVGMSAGFFLAAIVCLICNFAVSGELSWSRIVLASLIAAWGILTPLFRAQKKRICKSLLALSLMIFPYLAVLNVLLQVPLLRTMGMCIAIAALLGIWGLYGILTHVWSRKKYFALSLICFLMFAEEYGINRIIDEYIKRTHIEQSFNQLNALIILILAVSFLGISYFRERRKL